MSVPTPMNPMTTTTFAAKPGAMVGMSVWVLQTHHSGRAPLWNGPLPDEVAADAIIAHVKEVKGAMRAAGEGREILEQYDEVEQAVFRDIAVLMKYRAEVSLTPLDDMAAEFEVRKLGFRTPGEEA